MISVVQAQFPDSNTPIVTPAGTMSFTGMSFLRALYNRTGQGTGLVNQVNTAVAAATPATALMSDWNNVTSGTGSVTLPSLTGGQSVVVFNNSGFGITIAAPTGATIDGSASYSLANAKMQIYWFLSSAQILSTQLG